MRPIEELINASDHLHYEIWMLRISSYELQKHAEKIAKHGKHEFIAYTCTSHVTVSTYSSDAPISPPSKEEAENAHINSQLESFTIHLRSLLDFFYKDPKFAHKHDVLAVHFFNDPSEWLRVRPTMSEGELKSIKDRIGTEIAHLSYKRILISDSDKLWPFLELKSYVLDALKQFLLIVEPQLLSAHWESQSP